jgi:hypothetical protein
MADKISIEHTTLGLMGPIVYTATRAMPCHCVIFQIGERIILLDSGFGTREMLEPNSLLGDDVLWRVLPLIDMRLTALERLKARGTHPDADWMEQVARNATMQDTGYLNGCRYLLHDRDHKFCRQFRETLAAGGVKCLPLPARSPNLNAYAERWVRSIKQECLSQLILFGEKSLQRVVSNYLKHYHQERNHQGKDNLLLFQVEVAEASLRGAIRCRERLGGLLKYYSRAA